MEGLEGFFKARRGRRGASVMTDEVLQNAQRLLSMPAVIDRYLAPSPEEKLLFRLGRRGGDLRSLNDFNGPSTRQRLQTAMPIS